MAQESQQNDSSKPDSGFFAHVFKVAKIVGIVFLILLGLSILAEMPTSVQDDAAAGALVGAVMMASLFLARWLWRHVKTANRKWRPKAQAGATKAVRRSMEVAQRAKSKSAEIVRNAAASRSVGDRYDNLFKLKKLLDEGIINEQEYETERRALLDQG